MTRQKVVLFFTLPVLVSLALHYWVFDLDLIGYHVWRQTQTQTVIYNFSFSDNNILNPQQLDLRGGTTLLYEFPLYQWLIAQFNVVFGYSVAHTRALTFVVFIFFLAGFYKLLHQYVDAPVALVTNTLICFSPLLYYYCVNPLPDLLALCFSVWALYHFVRFISIPATVRFITFSVLLMLATLVKLPYVLFGGGALYYFYQAVKKGQHKTWLIKLLVLLLIMLPAVGWYAMAIPTWQHNNITHGLLRNNKTLAQLLDYLRFNLVSSVPELLTNYAACLFLFMGIYLGVKQKVYSYSRARYLVVVFVLFVVYFLFELNMIEKTHDYYLMPFVPFIFMLVTLAVQKLLDTRYRWFVFVITCLVPITAWLRINTRWNLEDPGFKSDYLYRQDSLQTLVPMESVCVIDHDDSRFIALYYLKRNGYSLMREEVNPDLLKLLYYKGARYLVTENTAFDTAAYAQLGFTKLYQGQLTVYRLYASDSTAQEK